MHATVINRYTNQSARAVCVMRGVSFSSLTGPGVSALYNCIPPTPSIGRIATTRTMMPMPPYQLSAWRQRFSDGAIESSPVSTVAPVVLSPDIVSKKASVKLRAGSAIRSGTVAMADMKTQLSVTSRKPSRERSSRLCLRVAIAVIAPAARHPIAAKTKSSSKPSAIDQRRDDRQQVGDAEQHQHRTEDIEYCEHA